MTFCFKSIKKVHARKVSRQSKWTNLGVSHYFNGPLQQHLDESLFSAKISISVTS